MTKPVEITSPWATPEDVAKILGVAKKRVKELKKLLVERKKK